jgi:OOP family OmpA-OmpF porin
MIAFICCSATSGSWLKVSIGTSFPRGAAARNLRYDFCVRWGLTALCVLAPLTAHAEPRPIVVGGFLGVEFLPNDVELGNSWAPDQVPQSGPALGGRVTWWALPHVLGDNDLALNLGLEGELQFAMSSTGSNMAAGRKSYASPLFGTGADLIASLTTGTNVLPHVLVGGGTNTMFTSSPFATDDTDPVVYWGLGAHFGLRSFAIRVDLRQGAEASRMGGMTSTFTCVVAIEKPVAWTTGPVEYTPPQYDERKRNRDLEVVTPPPPPPPVLDRDADGIPDDADKCPDAAEDKDGFQDQDGCPDLDNDGDGLADAQDRCPNEAETPNGYQDQDGCPDEIPAPIAAMVGPAPKLTFPRAKAKLTASAKNALDQIAATLLKFPDVRLRVVGHAGKGVSDDLARRRAEEVKWYLIDGGIATDRVDTSAQPADAGGARIELQLAH